VRDTLAGGDEMRDPEILHEEICRRLDKIIDLLSKQAEHSWQCGCGHWNGEAPEGVLCSCGLTVTNYATCKECGNRKLEFIPVEMREK